MFELLEFVMVSLLFVDLAARRGAEAVAWLKGAQKTATDELKKL